MANTTLLLATMDRINAGNCGWAQGDWNHCFGGQALRVMGQEPIMLGYANIRAAAMKILDLEPFDANRLFAAANRIGDLQRIVSEIVGKELVMPPIDEEVLVSHMARA